MEPKLPKIRTVQMTNLYLSVPENLTKFLSEFRQILRDNFQVIIVEGEDRYTCGQQHLRPNPDWEPFKHLGFYCLEQGLDDFEGYKFMNRGLGRLQDIL